MRARVVVPRRHVVSSAGHHAGLHERIGDVRLAHSRLHDARVVQAQPSVRQHVLRRLELKKNEITQTFSIIHRANSLRFLFTDKHVASC